MTRIPDPQVRAQVVGEIRARADVWAQQRLSARTLSEHAACHKATSVLEQLANDLETATEIHEGRGGEGRAPTRQMA